MSEGFYKVDKKKYFPNLSLRPGLAAAIQHRLLTRVDACNDCCPTRVKVDACNRYEILQLKKLQPGLQFCQGMPT